MPIGSLRGAAARIRERTGRPLFSFWLPHHEHAGEDIRASIGASAFEERVREGRQARDEDAIREAASLLGEFSASGAPAGGGPAPPRGDQSPTNSPVGS